MSHEQPSRPRTPLSVSTPTNVLCKRIKAGAFVVVLKAEAGLGKCSLSPLAGGRAVCVE